MSPDGASQSCAAVLWKKCLKLRPTSSVPLIDCICWKLALQCCVSGCHDPWRKHSSRGLRATRWMAFNTLDTLYPLSPYLEVTCLLAAAKAPKVLFLRRETLQV